MKFKHVPEPPSTASFVREAQAAVPLVPGTEDDCCARLMRRCGFDSRDAARTWLTFLRAVGLARETESGFERLRTEPTTDHLRTAFLDGVYAASEVADALLDAREAREADERGSGADDATPDASRGVSVDAAFDRVRGRVPGWERNRTSDWESVWRERVGRTLDWFVLLGLARETEDGYAATDALATVEGNGT